MKELFNVEEIIIKTSLLVLISFSQNDAVLMIFPSEYFSVKYIFYGFLGSLGFNAFAVLWSFEPDAVKDKLSTKNKIYKNTLRIILAPFVTFMILGLIKANFAVKENSLMTYGIGLGFFFDFYTKKKFIFSIFKSLAEKLSEMINKSEEKK